MPGTVRFHRVLKAKPERVYERLQWTDRFDDPNLPGEMTVTVRLKAVIPD